MWSRNGLWDRLSQDVCECKAANRQIKKRTLRIEFCFSFVSLNRLRQQCRRQH